MWVTHANLIVCSCSKFKQWVLMNKHSPDQASKKNYHMGSLFSAMTVCVHVWLLESFWFVWDESKGAESQERERAPERKRERGEAAWPHRSIKMIFSHKSDKEAEGGRKWVIQLWEFTSSDLGWKARETNRFHSPRWVWLLSSVVLNAKTSSVPSSTPCSSSEWSMQPVLYRFLTRLLFYHRESDVAAFHGHLDASHKSCKAEVSCRGSRACCETDQERTVTPKL